MDVMCKIRSVLTLIGGVLNKAVSFIVFCFLDLVDFILCFVYKVVDFCIEAEWKPCYCSSAKEAITGSGKILVSEQGESKIVCLTPSKLQLEDISDTLYSRPSLVTEVSKLTVNELKKLKLDGTIIQSCEKTKKGTVRSTFTINSTIVEMLQGKMVGQQLHPIPRWSDCDCKLCNSWTSSSKDTLFVKAQGPKVDLLGFGRSPKPTDSLYTLREHVDMIEKSVLEAYKVKSFHIVAHSLGCILALAIAVKHPGSVKSLTLLAPPYYPVPKGEPATQYVMRKVAPRRVWPVMAFCASIGCWYEHITRTVCLVICKNHRLWEFLTKLITRNRIRTFLLEGFFCHTHNAAWHTLHNIICGTASKLDRYLDAVRDRVKCDVTIFHGKDDEVIPLECSYNVQRRIPRARVKVVENKDHITIVVGRQKAFARELEEIWKRSGSD
ncbi:probable lysophospholipase BODYGUARD 3 isoform X2 [Herrania umbratica]|uniref:Probable lysophospholipase BODYGUARD 3 isoform X2 n=1 Tax=Herrania umbratica TaxID=108875 RepID=A0A6J1AP47_9ROSI|nr:probable lysophospholipase BODYGUARD 3 isoform X2 [Herrania umbratica]